MNMTLKAVYVCVTNSGRFGKGLTIKDAKKHAGIVTVKPGCEYYVQAALFNNPDDKQLEELAKCLTVNQVDGSPKYYDHERTEEDSELINTFHIGWLTVEKNF